MKTRNFPVGRSTEPGNIAHNRATLWCDGGQCSSDVPSHHFPATVTELSSRCKVLIIFEDAQFRYTVLRYLSNVCYLPGCVMRELRYN